MLLATTALVALLQLQRALRRHARPPVAHAASGWQGHFQHDGPLWGMAHCVFHQIAQRNGQRIKIAPNPDIVAFWQHQLQAVQQCRVSPKFLCHGSGQLSKVDAFLRQCCARLGARQLQQFFAATAEALQ